MELPYFKFFPVRWISGDITLCSMEAQGIFANLCCYYWRKGCSISLANARQRFSKYPETFQELLDAGIIEIDENDDVIIDFLIEQMNQFEKVSISRSKSGRKGGKATAKQMLGKRKANDKQKPGYKEEDKDIYNPPIVPPKGVNAVKGWKDDFQVYLSELREAYKELKKDKDFLSTQQRLNPRVNIPLTLEKACTNYWATEEGWMHKKKSRVKAINWRQTLTKSISQPMNKSYLEAPPSAGRPGKQQSDPDPKKIYPKTDFIN